ncbi:hypothetical protein OH76DRAFT_1320249, partial [Lentinus brumalis]
ARKYNSITRRLTDHERFMDAMANSDFESVGRLVKVAIKNNKGVREIVRRLELAIAGKYHVRSYQEKHYEVQRLVLSLGGPRLAYTLSKALNLPSISTTRAHSHTPVILLSVGFPTVAEVSTNLILLHNAGAFTTGRGASVRRRGWAFEADEFALEERPRYEPTQNAIVGMAREDSDSCDLATVTLDTLHAAADALEEGSLTLAKEATVVAIAAYDKEHYVSFPVLISGMKKTENEFGQARWISAVIEAWTKSPCGEVMYRPLWTVASDGDATRRRTLHRLLMSQPLEQTNPSYPALSGLRGLNLRCDSGARTLTIDYKHKFKNFASLLRLSAGVLVLNHHIQHMHLRALLRDELGFDTPTLTRLFDNSDHQNVPNAVSLLMAVRRLADVPKLVENVEHHGVVLLGRFIGYLVEPFISPEMSLSEQLTSLSAANHFLYILFAQNRTSFCPGQWYYDVASLIKNIFFTVARHKVTE